MGRDEDSRGRSPTGGPPAVASEGLRKHFGEIKALDGIDLEVESGTILALLGPNGAGKTTFVRIITTLMRPDAGRAWVAGHDVVHDAAIVRSMIGLAGQYAAVDDNLTGRENLEMVARLYHLSREESRARAGELLNTFDLEDAANRRVRTYSGGMRRRLDLAASLVARPPVLFLDEPTSGLDPRSRLGLWDIISGLVEGGTTVLLTTQYLDEADRLADRIAVLDHGRIIEQGTPRDLKECCGGDALLQLRVADRNQTVTAGEILKRFDDGRLRIDTDTGELDLPVGQGATILPEVVRLLDSQNVRILDIGLRQPTLDDVFLALTGRTAGTEGEATTTTPGSVNGRRGPLGRRRK